MELLAGRKLFEKRRNRFYLWCTICESYSIPSIFNPEEFSINSRHLCRKHKQSKVRSGS